MAKLILNEKPLTPAEIEERRFLENLARTPEERIKECLHLWRCRSNLKTPLKLPLGKGIVLARNYDYK